MRSQGNPEMPSTTHFDPAICAASKHQTNSQLYPPQISHRRRSSRVTCFPALSSVNSPTSHRMSDPYPSTHTSGVLDGLPLYLNSSQLLSSFFKQLHPVVNVRPCCPSPLFEHAEYLRSIHKLQVSSVQSSIFSGDESENRTSDYTLHIMTSCLRRYCTEK